MRLWLFALSVLTLMLETVDEWRERHARLFVGLEWFLPGVFTLEYLTRRWSVRNRLRYATSFFDLCDRPGNQAGTVREPAVS